jgi:hypothetical protein
VIQGLQITSKKNLASKSAKQIYFCKNSLFKKEEEKKVMWGPLQAWLLHVVKEYLETTAENQWFKMSSCKLIMQVCQ